MKSTLIILMLMCACFTACVAHAPTSSDQALLQGTWLAHSESQNGQSKPVVFQYLFTRDTLTFTDEHGKQVNYAFALVPHTSPKLLNIWPEGSPASASPVSVAYELNGDSLKIVVAPPGSTPTDISDNHHQELISCRRKCP